MKKLVVIMCVGGFVFGINIVVSIVVKVFFKDGYWVLGVYYGYEGLFLDEVLVKVFDFYYVDCIFSCSGFILIMSWFKFKDSDFRMDFFIKENVKFLVIIGGDDIVFIVNWFIKFFKM